MKKLLISVFAIAAIVSCKKTVIDSPTDKDFGYISFELSSDADMEVVTKAAQTADQLALYDVTLFKGTDRVWTKKYSEVAEAEMKLAVGDNYNVYVENLSEEAAAPADGKGSVRLVGTEDNVVVSSGANTSVSVHCVPVNSRVTVDFDDDFYQIFSNPQLTLTDGERPFAMTNGHEIENGVYYSADTELTWTLETVLTADSTPKTYPGKTPVVTAAGKWTKITFSASLSNGSLKVTITADDEMQEDPVSVEIDPFEGL